MDAPTEVQLTGEFKCQLCGLKAPYMYYGPQLTLCHRLEFMKDSTGISKCGSSICQTYSISSSQDLCTQCVFVKDCSLFYSKRFCLCCVKENLKAFPLEIQEDMNKRKPQQKSSKKPQTKHKS